MCVSTFQRGFSWSGLAVQLVEVIVFVPFLLFGVGRGGRYLLAKVESDERAYFVLMFGTMALACQTALPTRTNVQNANREIYSQNRARQGHANQH